MYIIRIKFELICLVLLLLASATQAQTTAFSYQGHLNEGGAAANGTYEMQFQLFDAVKGGNQIGKAFTDPNVAVANGIFTTTLDFGASFDGTPRYLEVGVRPSKDPDPFTILSPRSSINSVPYAIRSTNAATADTATNATQLGGVDASQYITTKTGPTSFIQNTTTQQAGANLNIDGNGTVGSLDTTGPVSLGGTAPPAPAPAGGGRIYFDAASNKVKVSENGGAFVNLVGATGVSGSGTTNSIPLWSAGTTLGSSLISQVGGNTIQLPGFVSLAATASGNNVSFGSPNSETGMIISGPTGRADVRFDGTTLRLFEGPLGSPPSNGVTITSSNVQLPNNVSLGAGAQGNNVSFGSPNGETGMTISGASGRADIRYNGTLKLLNGTGGIPPAGNGVAIDTSGNVTIGDYSGNTAKLMVASPGLGIAVSATVSSNFNDAIRGINGGSGTGVEGQSNGGIGVYGTNSLSGGTGIYAQSQTSSGTALHVDGNATQSRSGGGLVKAMAHIDRNGALLSCFNGVTGSGGNCGFTITKPLTGVTRIDFGFQISDRFVLITPEYSTTCNVNPIACRNAGANFRVFSTNQMEVFTFDADNAQDTADAGFMIIMY